MPSLHGNNSEFGAKDVNLKMPWGLNYIILLRKILIFSDMGNVASWSGTKTLNYFEYYDQACADFFNQGRAQFVNHFHVNWATLLNTKNGPTMDGPTTRGPFKNIENEGYLGNNSGKNFLLILK